MEGAACFIAILFIVLFALLLLYNSHVFNLKKKPINEHKKKLPPSPPSLPFIGHLHLLRPPRHLSIPFLADRHGPIVFLRLGHRPALVLSSPSAVEECFSKENDITFSNHPRMLAGDLVGYGNTSLFFAPYGPHWRNLRRISREVLLSKRCLEVLTAARADEVTHLMQSMWSRANGPMGRGKVELRTRLFETAYNAISRVVTGRRCYGEEAVGEEAVWFRRVMKEGLDLVFAFNPGDFFPALARYDVRQLGRRMEKLIVEVDEFVGRLLDERRSKKEDKFTTFIDAMLSFQETNPEYYTDQIIAGLVMTMMISGSGVVVDTLEAAMLLLLIHPEILNKAREEIDKHVEHDRVLSESDLPKLPFLHCIVQEVLRLCPTPIGIPPRESSSDCTIQGFHVPRGTMLFINIWGIHRDPELWDEPLKFKPERFVDGVSKARAFSFLPFGSGRRSCPGEGLAHRVLGLTLGVLIQCFEWEPATEKQVEMSTVLGFDAKNTKPFFATYWRRDCMSNAISRL